MVEVEGIYRFTESYQGYPKGRVFQVDQVKEDCVVALGKEFPKDIPVELCDD